MSVVKFLCANGHPLTAPLNLVGREGKCPKCNVAFVVPPPEQANVISSGGGSSKKFNLPSGSSLQLPEPLGSGIREIEGSGTQTRNDLFVFLCPNGHRLNGPPSLKGKLGQCPHCGARFRVPDDEAADTANIPANSVTNSGSAEVEPPFADDVHALAHIMNRLWTFKGDSGEIEILLPEGDVMTPEHFSSALSAKEYGVFATREGAGYSLSVVPWANVRRVNVHRVDQLPKSAFPD